MKLSVITINLNNKDGLEKTIESVVSQTYKSFEYIIIDGNSSDGSVDVIKQYANRVDHWISRPDMGIYNAMNKEVRQKKGEHCSSLNNSDSFVNNLDLEKGFENTFSKAEEALQYLKDNTSNKSWVGSCFENCFC